MIRVLQISVVIVALLVARRVIYGWLKQPDALPRLLRQGLDAILIYFIYVTAGLLLLSAIAGRGFGAGKQLAAALLSIGGAVYVGLGILGLWLYLARQDSARRR